MILFDQGKSGIELVAGVKTDPLAKGPILHHSVTTTDPFNPLNPKTAWGLPTADGNVVGCNDGMIF